MQQLKACISVHGINTRGVWQKDFAPYLARAGIVPYLSDYGHVLASMFNPLARASKVRWFRNYYDQVKQDSGLQRPSVVAHSYGTWLVCEALRTYDDIVFDRIILSGSIVDEHYPWAQYLDEQRVMAVRNEIATRDPWPGAAAIVSGAFGKTGVVGFSATHASLSQHTHAIGHSDMFGPAGFAQWAAWLAEPAQAR